MLYPDSIYRGTTCTSSTQHECNAKTTLVAIVYKRWLKVSIQRLVANKNVTSEIGWWWFAWPLSESGQTKICHIMKQERRGSKPLAAKKNERNWGRHDKMRSLGTESSRSGCSHNRAWTTYHRLKTHYNSRNAGKVHDRCADLVDISAVGEYIYVTSKLLYLMTLLLKLKLNLLWGLTWRLGAHRNVDTRIHFSLIILLCRENFPPNVLIAKLSDQCSDLTSELRRTAGIHS